MKRNHFNRYVLALADHAASRVSTATDPLCVNAFRFFDEACFRQGIEHTFEKVDDDRIVSLFTEQLCHACHSDRDGFPIFVFKATKQVVELVGHGRQAIVDADLTAERYLRAATKHGGNPFVGWALFGPGVQAGHPMLGQWRVAR